MTLKEAHDMLPFVAHGDDRPKVPLVENVRTGKRYCGRGKDGFEREYFYVWSGGTLPRRMDYGKYALVAHEEYGYWQVDCATGEAKYNDWRWSALDSTTGLSSWHDMEILNLDAATARDIATQPGWKLFHREGGWFVVDEESGGFYEQTLSGALVRPGTSMLETLDGVPLSGPDAEPEDDIFATRPDHWRAVHVHPRSLRQGKTK